MTDCFVVYAMKIRNTLPLYGSNACVKFIALLELFVESLRDRNYIHFESIRD